MTAAGDSAARDDAGRSRPGERRRDVLRVLKESATPLGIAAIAEQLGLHPNTVRFHLDALERAGQAERAPAGRPRPGRPPSLFRAVRAMDPGGPRHYRLLAEVLTASLASTPHPSERAVDAGHQWGRRLASQASRTDELAGPVERLVSLLDELDFAPDDASEGAQQVGLHRCPFLEVAERQVPIVCPVHLGLMQGALDAWDAPVTVVRLDPFAEPDLCVAHLAPVGRAS